MFAAHNLTYIFLGRTADSHTLHIMGCNGDNTWDKTLTQPGISPGISVFRANALPLSYPITQLDGHVVYTNYLWYKIWFDSQFGHKFFTQIACSIIMVPGSSFLPIGGE